MKQVTERKRGRSRDAEQGLSQDSRPPNVWTRPGAPAGTLRPRPRPSPPPVVVPSQVGREAQVERERKTEGKSALAGRRDPVCVDAGC